MFYSIPSVLITSSLICFLERTHKRYTSVVLVSIYCLVGDHNNKIVVKLKIKDTLFIYFSPATSMLRLRKSLQTDACSLCLGFTSLNVLSTICFLKHPCKLYNFRLTWVLYPLNISSITFSITFYNILYIDFFVI